MEKHNFLEAARGVASDLLEKQYSGAKIEDIQPETAHALSHIEFYHIGDEHELCLRDSEGFSPAIIPSLSKEILGLNYRQGSPGNYRERHCFYGN